MNRALVHSIGVGRFLDWKALDAEGSARGILLFWDKRRLSLVESKFGSYSFSYVFSMVGDDFLWMFTGVYGPVEKRHKEIFWEELSSIKGLWNGPWYLGGHFNENLFPTERSRGGRISSTTRRFSDIINELGLRDLPLQGGPFTWRGGRNGRAISRLDRFLVTTNGESKFNKAVQRCLLMSISYHFPILLDSDGIRTGPSPFRFELMWLKHEGFKEILKGWWQSLVFQSSFSFILAAKRWRSLVELS